MVVGWGALNIFLCCIVNDSITILLILFFIGTKINLIICIDIWGFNQILVFSYSSAFIEIILLSLFCWCFNTVVIDMLSDVIFIIDMIIVLILVIINYRFFFLYVIMFLLFDLLLVYLLLNWWLLMLIFLNVWILLILRDFRNWDGFLNFLILLI